MTHVKYPKIGQLKSAIKTINHLGLENVLYEGTVKIHGTNAGVRIDKDGNTTPQSRNQNLAPGNDSYGFYSFVMDNEDAFTLILSAMREHLVDGFEELVVFGEWCGGNIQGGVGISGLKKMFIVFGVKVDGKYLSSEVFDDLDFWGVFEERGIYTVRDFDVRYTTIGSHGNTGTIEDISRWVEEFENLCPVANKFGKKGIGEGLVFKPMDTELLQNTDLWFKAKGAKHSATKVKTIQIDTVKLGKAADFIEYAVTENRMKQGLEYLKEMGLEHKDKNTGTFIGWVVKDVLEEESDALEVNKLNKKDWSKMASKKCREFFIGDKGYLGS